MKEVYQSWEAIRGEWEGLDVVTACTIIDDGIVGRGVAILGAGEQPDEKLGMEYAKRHALRAIKNRGNTLITDRRAIAMLCNTECQFLYHVEMNPVLTWQERRMLFGRKAMFEYDDKLAVHNNSIQNIRINPQPLYNSAGQLGFGRFITGGLYNAKI